MKFSKTLVAAAAATFLTSSGFLSAQESPPATPNAAPSVKYKDNDLNAYFGFGPSVFLTELKEKGESGSYSENLYGGFLGGGFKVASVGGGSVIGAFELGVYSGSIDTGYDEFKMDRIAVPILTTWSYEYDQLLDGRLRLRAGATLGVTTFISSFEATASGYGYSYYEKSTKSGAAVTGGVSLGATWNITEGFYADFGYRLLGTSGVKTHFKEEGKLVNQLNLSIGWRF
ncbi:MAG: hypothetical protein LBT53_01110 [Puniceicoccales bacterium]|jgi:hypothetical protein|nr:hypothetical protein [Puniceicoccales bacterium]